MLADIALAPKEEHQAVLAERLVRAVVRDEEVDALMVEVNAAFDDAERAALLFAVGYFIGMQHLSRSLHFESPDRCEI